MLRMQDRARQGGHAGHETERAFRDKGSSVSDLGLFANSINLLKLLYGFSIHTLLCGIDDVVAKGRESSSSLNKYSRNFCCFKRFRGVPVCGEGW